MASGKKKRVNQELAALSANPPKKAPEIKPLSPVTAAALDVDEPKKKLRGLPAEIDGTTIIRETIPLWDAKWNQAALLKRLAEMSQREFDRGYRQYAISDEDLLFKPESIELALDRSLVIPERVVEGDIWFRMHRYGGIDLSIATAEKEGDYFVISRIAIDNAGIRYWLGMTRTRGVTLNRQCDLLIEDHANFRFEVVTCESNGYQDALRQHTLERAADIPVRSYFTGALQKTDIELGLPGLALEFERQRWRIPYGDARSRRIAEPLLDELHAYPSPGHHDDALMATFLARESLRAIERTVPRIHVIRL